jgi:alpha-glucosidase
MKYFKFFIVILTLLAAFSCGDKKASVRTDYAVSENVVSKNINNCAIGEAKIGLGEHIAMLSLRNGDNPFLFQEITAKQPNFLPTAKNLPTDAVVSNDSIKLEFDNDKAELTYTDGRNVGLAFDNDKIIVTIRNTKYLYGFGERFGTMNLMGDDKVIDLRTNHHYGNRAYMPIPVVFDSNGTFVYFGSPFIGKAAIHTEGDTVTVTYSNGGNNKDMQGIDLYIGFSSDRSLISASAEYLKLVGLPPLPPKWAFGYIQSKYGYFTPEQMLKIANRFAEENIPLSAMVLDLYWFKTMGDIDWNEDTFPDPKGFIAELESKGVKLITISEPFFDKLSKNYKPFDSRKMLAKDENGKTAYIDNWWGKGGIIDYTNPKAQDILWKKCYASQLAVGVGAFWTDLGEPEGVNDKTKFAEGVLTEVRNTYNVLWSKGIYEHWLAERPNERPFILTRSGWSGSQKYGVSVWSGDVKTDWSGMELQPFMMQSASLAGFSFCGHDVGGFVGEGYAELFEKWQEFGLFSPVHRAHGSDADREPWAFDEEVLPQVAEVLRKRAQFVPYIYSTAYNTTVTGEPFIRPMDVSALSSTEEQNAVLSSQYYFGPSIVFAPTFESSTTKVYLPKLSANASAKWLDLATTKTYAAGKTYSISHVPGKPSYFLKPGGIFVENAAASYSELKELNIYINATGDTGDCFVVYNDDGISQEYRTQDKCNKLEIRTKFDGGTIITINPLVTNYTAELPKLNLFIAKDNPERDGYVGYQIDYPTEPQSIVVR